MEIIIDGKTFKYNRITLEIGRQSLQWLSRPETSTFKKADWNELCRLALKKNFLWKYFRITPKQLRFKNISIRDAGGLQVGFFALQREEQKEQAKLYKDLTDLKQPSTA
jgi:hypothetical protein